MGSVQDFVKSALASSMSTLGGEDVTVGNQTAKGVIGEADTMLELDTGGDNNQRAITAVFPAGTFTTLPKSGQRATARGQTWQISDVRAGSAALTITMEEPTRRGR